MAVAQLNFGFGGTEHIVYISERLRARGDTEPVGTVEHFGRNNNFEMSAVSHLRRTNIRA